MGADGRRCGATGRGAADWTQASRPELVPAAGSTSSAARSELAGLRLSVVTIRAGSSTTPLPVWSFKIKANTLNYADTLMSELTQQCRLHEQFNYGCLLHVFNTVCMENG